ncbi:MAG: TPM domain-containing protein [Bacteroidota bacterium]
MKYHQIFKPEVLAAIDEKIKEAEQMTSGEIRVYIEDHSIDDPLDRAAFLFEKLGMSNTELRNGVLIYIACTDRRFCIIGDAGIHAKVGDGFWQEISNRMHEAFKEGNMREGLLSAIISSGQALSLHFPRGSNDTNELSNEVILG